MPQMTWIDRRACQDDKLYRASIKIMNICRLNNVSLAALVCTRQAAEDVLPDHADKLPVTALCVLDDTRMAPALTQAAKENVDEVLQSLLEQQGVR